MSDELTADDLLRILRGYIACVGYQEGVAFLPEEDEAGKPWAGGLSAEDIRALREIAGIT